MHSCNPLDDEEATAFPSEEDESMREWRQEFPEKMRPRPRLRRPVSVPGTRQFNDTLLADVHFWNFRGREVLVFSMIDEATRFHVTQILPSQSARDLYEAIMAAWLKWAGAPRFLLVNPHKSHLARQFIEQL